MAEYEVVDVRVVLQVVLGEELQWFGLRAMGHGFWVLGFEMVVDVAVASPVEAEVDEEMRVDHAGKPLESLVAETPEHKSGSKAFVAHINKVAMREEESLVGNVDHAGIVVNLYAAFGGEVVAHPHVVVAGKEMYLDAAIGEFADFAQEASISFRDYIGIFEPEVEHVAHEVYGLGTVLDIVEETYETSFVGSAVRNGSASQVGIGEKVDHRVRRLGG